ncbi:rhomboid family intramembrane serine protease [Desulfallas thermosapovorans]|uniref:Membrane associated rhomboid family serine protease n=1 Tax=Desulfallas thermosapovorans DSM 6562 TaxID=1121431 RepID=A0A5S4ZPA9_9FIRM|nr:rhomboid family intramembrane serine protease [Desulfallas thermosapovorans]TYO94696.1 membrane associated rhomboid family serine protease [Desulfallas thermosapovorans DSM 6562]
MIPLRDSVKSQSFPIVNLTIIALNVLIYLWEVSMEPYLLNQVYYTFGLVPVEALNAVFTGSSLTPVLVSFVTSTFIHGGWLHVISNMLFLWVFGDNVEDRLGHFKYLLFYLAAGFAGGLAHIISDPVSTVPVVGASGAVAGVLGAYIIAFPRSRILALVPIIIIFTLMEIPAVVFIAIWFILQLFNGVASLGGTADTVAYWAHIGGFIIGAVLIKTMSPRVRGYFRP